MQLGEIVNKFINLLLQGVVPALLALGLLYFMTGLVKYLSSSGDGTKRSEGVRVMINGLVALTIILTVWGLVALLSSLVGSPIGIPQF